MGLVMAGAYTASIPFKPLIYIGGILLTPWVADNACRPHPESPFLRRVQGFVASWILVRSFVRSFVRSCVCGLPVAKTPASPVMHPGTHGCAPASGCLRDPVSQAVHADAASLLFLQPLQPEQQLCVYRAWKQEWNIP
ncbi:PEPKR2 [Symbiodinium natans]|uniref:PEPKR2 protein n=1 Tax=Symbiodinium natans TaxID=878477 RepID=A0A812TUG3_9DINO|nr:PEPKR2 [Symbiodinium natans]